VKSSLKIISAFWGILFFFSKVYGAEISNFSLPTSPVVKSGQASFEQTHDKLTIQQSSNKLITNWSSFNIGKDAGQSIMHCHIHLIPRRKGDVEDPRGGVRGVIPEKQKYKRK